MNWYQNWREKNKKEERQQDLITRISSIGSSLMYKLETEDSILVYNQVSELFKQNMQDRLKRNQEESNNIKIFLRDEDI